MKTIQDCINAVELAFDSIRVRNELRKRHYQLGIIIDQHEKTILRALNKLKRK